ncbi:hypothetical protein ACGYU5_15275 [Burkholderia pseudomallei]
MRLKGVLLVALLACCTAAHAADSVQMMCSLSQSTGGIDAVLREATTLDGLIERVPPDEAQYLSDEYKAATQPRNAARLQMLYRRAYYPAWELHGQLQKLIGQLQNIQHVGAMTKLGTPADRAAQQVSDAAFAIVSAEGAYRDFSDYVRYDQSRSQPVLSKTQIEEHNFDLGILGSNLAVYVSCIAQSLRK